MVCRDGPWGTERVLEVAVLDIVGGVVDFFADASVEGDIVQVSLAGRREVDIHSAGADLTFHRDVDPVGFLLGFRWGTVGGDGDDLVHRFGDLLHIELLVYVSLGADRVRPSEDPSEFVRCRAVGQSIEDVEGQDGVAAYLNQVGT